MVFLAVNLVFDFCLVKEINWSNIILEIKIGLKKCWGPDNFGEKICFIDASFVVTNFLTS